jgi:hypothetical protein
MSPAFDEIRAYIRTGKGRPPVSLFVHERFRNACQQGPHQHSLILAGRHDRKRVDSIVRLFGGLCYFVTLSECYGGADFCSTLMYDAQRGEIVGVRSVMSRRSSYRRKMSWRARKRCGVTWKRPVGRSANSWTLRFKRSLPETTGIPMRRPPDARSNFTPSKGLSPSSSRSSRKIV